MKTRLTYNYWLMIVAWCMFINGYNLLAVLFALCASITLLSLKRRINYWRLISLSIITFNIITFILSKTNILFYFDNLLSLLFMVCINAFITNEYLYLFKVNYLYSYLLFMAVGMIIFIVVVILLPKNLYTLFTKGSLYIMVCLIFMPYLIPMMCCLINKKKEINILKNQLLQKG